MQRDVRLAHNYFEALFQPRDMPRITALLNKLATPPGARGEAVRHRALARDLADAPQQQQQLAAAAQQKA